MVRWGGEERIDRRGGEEGSIVWEEERKGT